MVVSLSRTMQHRRRATGELDHDLSCRIPEGGCTRRSKIAFAHRAFGHSLTFETPYSSIEEYGNQLTCNHSRMQGENQGFQ